jgi:patatin-like phospholipase/acyl hydrolase
VTALELPANEREDAVFSNGVVRMLALDGGGIRGVLPARVLVELERITGKPVASLFDVVAGTSTGGLIALALTKPNGVGAPEFSAREVLDLYLKFGRVIFPRVRSMRSRGEFSSARAQVVQRIGCLLSPQLFGNARYVATGLESVLETYLGTARLSDALSDVIVPAYDWRAGRAMIFNSRDAREGTALNPPMTVVARATAAAPTYFPPVRFPVDPAREVILIDGGVVANNPSFIAFFEALRLERLQGREAKVVVVSLGTGRPPERAVTYKEVFSRSWLKLAMGMLGVVFDGTSEVADELIARIVAGRGPGSHYWRFQTELLGANLEMDDASDRNLGRLLELSEQMIDERRSDLAEIGRLLVDVGARR